MKSGVWLHCNCLGVLLPLSVVWSLGDLGLAALLVASNPKYLGDEMAGGHLLLLGRSSVLRYVDELGVLLVAAIKNFQGSSSRRVVASSSNLGVVLLQPLVRWSCVEGLLRTPAGDPCPY